MTKSPIQQQSPIHAYPSPTPKTHWIALAVVAALLTGATLWPAIDLLQPVRDVAVTAALPARSDTSIGDTQLTSASNSVGERDADRPTEATRNVRTVQAPGWVEPDPYYTAVSALADGVVASVDVLEGQSVEKGQVLATLVADDAELTLARATAALGAAEAILQSARAELAAAQTDWEQPVERERAVAATNASLAEAGAELKRQPADIRAMEAELARWREERRRVIEAFDNGAATSRERIVADYQVASREAALEALRQQTAVLEARVDRLAAEARAAQRNAELRVHERLALDRARAGVADAEAALLGARAERDEAALRLSRMTIRAPMAGNVLRRIKLPGDKVMLGMDNEHSSHVIHLYDPPLLHVRVDVPLADASQVYIGQSCEVVVDVLPDRTFAGEVTRITHRADLQKNTLQMKVRILDPVDLLKPEMLARVRFLGSGDTPSGKGEAQTPSQAANTAPGDHAEAFTVRVPRSALDGARVWVVRHRQGVRGEAVAIDIDIATVDENNARDADPARFVAVRGPLRVGELVIADAAAFDLQPGDRVRMTNASNFDTPPAQEPRI